MATHKELEQFIHGAVLELRELIRNGSSDLPVLDPYRGLSLKEEIPLRFFVVELSLQDPVINGLATLNMPSLPVVDIESRSITFDIEFDELDLETGGLSVRTWPKIWKSMSTQLLETSDIDIRSTNLLVSNTLSISLADDVPHIAVIRSDVQIEDIDLDIDDQKVLDVVLDRITDHLCTAISAVLKDALQKHLDRRIAEEYLAQQETVDKLVALYRMKQAQGYDLDENGNPEKPTLIQGFGGVGQMPLPMFWHLPEVDESLGHVDLKELNDRARTGDVVLFSGSAASSHRTRRFTQCPYSHVAMIVNEPVFGDKPLLWQATSSTHLQVLSNRRDSGLQLNNLAEAITEYVADDHDAVIVYRPLVYTDRSASQTEALIGFVKEMDGKPYTDDMQGLYLMGLMEIDNEDDQEYFCSGLVAQTLIEFELLDSVFRQYQYAPRDFCSAQQALPFLSNEFSAGEEFIVDVPLSPTVSEN